MFEEEISGKSPGMWEKSIERRLENLPGPLQKTWRDRLADARDEDLAAMDKELADLLSRRAAALSRTPALFAGMSSLETDEEKIARMLDKIQLIENDNQLFIAEGKTAHVFRDPNQPAVCYKFVHNLAEYEAWNSVDKEAHFLEDLSSLSVDGVRSPSLISVIDRPEMKVIVMERLDATSIDGIIRSKRPLPDGFDTKVFFQRLRAYVEKMHERGIYHRDLHEGNILIGRDGTPYVIDFGRGARSISPDFAYEAYDRAGINRIVLPSDEKWIDQTEALLRAHLTGQPVELRNT